MIQPVVDATEIPEGTRRLEGNTPLLLHDPGCLWIVDAGRVEIFAVAVREGEPTGARHFVCSLQPGEAAFGVAVGAAGLGLLAVGTVGTRVRSRSLALPAPDGVPLDRAAMLDGWITALGTGVADVAGARTEHQLAASQPAELAPGELARPAAGVLWIRVASGAVSVMDALTLPAPGDDAPFPLPEPFWLRAEAAATVAATATTDVLAAEAGWPDLGAWHALILDLLARTIAAAERAEADRLRREVEHNAAIRSQALGQLAGVLDPVPPAPGTAAGDDPLLAACRLVARQLGVDVRPPVRTGHGEDALSQIARASGLRLRQVTPTAGWWRADGGPMLAYLGEDRAPVAVLPGGTGRFEVVNPADGSCTPVDREVAALLGKEAWVLYVPFPDRPLNVWDLLRFGLAGGRRDLVRIGALGMVTGLLATVPPIATSEVFGRIIPRSEESRLLPLAGVMALSALAIALFQVTRSVAVTRIEARIDASIQPAIWDRLLRLPTGFFRTYSAGDLASRAMAIDTARQLLTGTAVSSVLGSIFSFFSLALMFSYDVRLAVVATILTLIALAVTTIATYRQLRFQRRMTQIQSRVAGMVLQFLTGIAKLRVAGAEDRAFATWAAVFSEQKKQDVRGQAASDAASVFGGTWPLVGTVVIFAVVAQSGLDSISTANLLGFLVAFTQFLTTTLLMTTAISSVLQCVPLYEQARPILQTLPEVDATKADPGELTGAIEINHVSFRYTSDGPLALSDISLRIEPGEFVAFVGPSGAGKSSLFRLLLGFDTPESGSIYYDGKDLSGLDTEALRRQMGVVTQDSKVLPGTIQANILGTSLLTVTDAWEAARLAGLDADIRQMPMGMQTIISEGGATFSGGQLQRLMIARAIVRRPRILLFDEATSALDNRTQAIVSHSLERLQATRIVIAHRLSTIEHADRIYVIEGGRIVESGTFDALLATPGPFAALAKRQLA